MSLDESHDVVGRRRSRRLETRIVIFVDSSWRARTFLYALINGEESAACSLWMS